MAILLKRTEHGQKLILHRSRKPVELCLELWVEIGFPAHNFNDALKGIML
jgi:hypothetical protein